MLEKIAYRALSISPPRLVCDLRYKSYSRCMTRGVFRSLFWCTNSPILTVLCLKLYIITTIRISTLWQHYTIRVHFLCLLIHLTQVIHPDTCATIYTDLTIFNHERVLWRLWCRWHVESEERVSDTMHCMLMIYYGKKDSSCMKVHKPEIIIVLSMWVVRLLRRTRSRERWCFSVVTY